jgi:hypothetical protein
LKAKSPDSPVLDLRELSAVYPISTFDTDHVLVREGQLDLAVDTLRENEHKVDSAGER